MKKLNITKERFEKSRYFTRKYGKLEYVSESGKLFKTDKDNVLMFVKESIDSDPALVCPYCGGDNCEVSIGTDDLNFTGLDRLQGETFNVECWCNDCDKPYNVTLELNVKEVYPNEDFSDEYI
jgi:hypothetical protein